MLRLRWALLNNPSSLIHRLHIVIFHPLAALGNRGVTNNPFFVDRVKKKEGSKGGGIPYGNRKQEQKHNETIPATVSQCFRNTFQKH